MSTESPGRIAVFSDIHGNLHALQAVLSAIGRMEIKTLVCLGDVVGYGAFPNECIDEMRRRDVPTLAGNHDHAAIGRTEVRFFNDIARRAVEWTAQRLTPENMQWLERRPYRYELPGGLLFIHASPINPEGWGYVLTFGDARSSFDAFDQRVCFIGHSHQPAVVEKDGEELTCPEASAIPLREGCRYLINVGSVGQPRDRNPNACYVTVDLGRNEIEFHREAYDVQAAQQAIRAAGLPEELAERLGFGW